MIAETPTGMGMCYTFNPSKEDILKVRQTGASFGFSLIINVEQYEHMIGPIIDAGLKACSFNISSI